MIQVTHAHPSSMPTCNTLSALWHSTADPCPLCAVLSAPDGFHTFLEAVTWYLCHHPCSHWLCVPATGMGSQP